MDFRALRHQLEDREPSFTRCFDNPGVDVVGPDRRGYLFDDGQRGRCRELLYPAQKWYGPNRPDEIARMTCRIQRAMFTLRYQLLAGSGYFGHPIAPRSRGATSAIKSSYAPDQNN